MCCLKRAGMSVQAMLGWQTLIPNEVIVLSKRRAEHPMAFPWVQVPASRYLCQGLGERTPKRGTITKWNLFRKLELNSLLNVANSVSPQLPRVPILVRVRVLLRIGVRVRVRVRPRVGMRIRVLVSCYS